ncbi:MAG: glycerate kinase [Pseudomonadota bacterium]
MNLVHAFLGGTLVSGSQFVLEASGFETLLQRHDLLIVGEGKSDFQTLQGKSPGAAIQVAERLGKKSVLISGLLGEGSEKIQAPGLVAKLACGREPDPKTALRQAVLELIGPEAKIL